MRTKMMQLCAWCLLLLMAACKDDDTIIYESRFNKIEKTLVIVAPLNNPTTRQRLERTAQWFIDNFHHAQLNNFNYVNLNVEWHNEDSEDLIQLSKSVAARDDVSAVIGPFSSANVSLFAPACQKVHKPVIAPAATSEDVIRRFAVNPSGAKSKQPFLWSLTETDVTFSEVMMSLYATFAAQLPDRQVQPSAALFAPDNTYGRTFTDWAPYQAENMGIKLLLNKQYSADSQLLTDLTNFLSTHKDDFAPLLLANFCVVENIGQLYEVARLRRNWLKSNGLVAADVVGKGEDAVADDYWPEFEETFRTWFGFSALTEEDLTVIGERGRAILQGYQGFSPYADPSTGFEMSYEKKFSTKPTFTECKFYDALMLAAFAICYKEYNIDLTISDLNDAIIAITNGIDESGGTLSGAVWNVTPMEVYLNSMEHGQLLKFRGASGDISFDQDTYTVSTHTTYVHWKIIDGKIEHLNYFGSDGSRRISQSTAAWRWLYDERKALEDLARQADESASTILYGPLGEQYALLVQGSDGFANYRHQADVLGVYQLLRANGFDDNHIILVIDSSIATDEENTEPGIVRNRPDGPDLLAGTTDGVPAAVVDYDNRDLSPTDIAHILSGIVTPSTPVVINPSRGDHANILFYWSGHGRNTTNGGADEFKWRSLPTGEGFSASLLQQTVSRMHQQRQFRKLLVVAEPCYGEAILAPLTGLSGVLGLSGASANEQSFADHWNGDLGRLGTWMSDCFTTNLVNYLTAYPSTTYRDLYLYCVQHTLGSHAKIINAANFGNLYLTGPQEFFQKSKI